MDNFFLSQLLAGLAFTLGMIAFQFKRRESILKLFCLSAFVYGVHFLVLGESEAAIFVFISSVRFFIASFSKHRNWLWVFLFLTLINLIWNYDSLVNFLSFAATAIGTYGSFHAKVKILRACMGLATLIWIIHNVIVWSPVAATMEVFFLVSNGVGWWRDRAKNTPIAHQKSSG